MSDTTGRVAEGEVLWEPTEAYRCRMHRYMEWLAETEGLSFADYHSLWQWSVDNVGWFWKTIWDHFEVTAHSEPEESLAQADMPGARWFPGATLNHAEHLLRRRDNHIAVVYRREDGKHTELTYAGLYRLAARAAAGLAELGVGRGDRVAAYACNTPETLAAFLATASLGAVWSACSPEFGVSSVLDRFKQIEPKVLLADRGYLYNGKHFDRCEAVEQIRQGLDGLSATVAFPEDYDEPAVHEDGCLTWDAFLGEACELAFTPVPFDHPLWVLYSSGTTGLPKPIVQGHGGILLEHLKAAGLHCDLGPNDRFFWFTTTGWMMWNFLTGGLLHGATIVLYDGSPAYPDLSALWRLAQDTRVTYFGTSAPFIMSCRKEGLKPRESLDLGALRALGSTGAPLPAEGFSWVYEQVKPDLLLGSVSGGTDVCTAFVLSCPLLPVRAGEIQCRGLGCKVEAYDPAGESLVDEVGELVISAPMPSMPIYFYNDEGDRRYRGSYFEAYEGVWAHGDWIKVTKEGSCVIYGRSDSTLNRGGVRMGTSELYRVVEGLDGVHDSLVVDTGSLGQDGKLWLFVVLQQGRELDDDLRQRIHASLRQSLSPRHVPDEVRAIDQVPRTLNGKKLEVPIKRIFCGVPPGEAVNTDTLADPAALEPFLELVNEVKAVKKAL